MTTVKQYDYLNRLLVISNGPSAGPAVSFAYSYNAANQRVVSRLADRSYWRYEYDGLGQVVSGKKFWSDGTPVAGQQFGYALDDIGNRTSTTAGGDQDGANPRYANYFANSLNQYTSRDVPGAVDVMGLALATNTVTVNGQAPYRKGEYFRAQLGVDNSSVPVWEAVTVHAPTETDVTGHVFVPKTQEQFGYDADGNLASDGRWTYTWDGENRLIALTANTSAGPQERITFAYDAQGRRFEKVVSVWNGSSYVPQSTILFLYDGWNLIAEVAPNDSLIRSYAWGTDLSGTPQGAGGVSGLLEVSCYGTQTTNSFVAFDGNGNTVSLVNADDGTVAANYEYGPFGELLRATGPMAKASPFRFSTKYQDDETDLLYYGYRYYNASTGRWPNRDPIGELGAILLRSYTRDGAVLELDQISQEPNYSTFVRNNPVSLADKLGLQCCCTPGQTHINKVQGQQTSVGKKPGDDKWVDVLNTAAKYCPELKPVSDAVDKAKKAFVGFAQIYLSTGYVWNFYVKVEFQCCNKGGGWGPNQSVGPEKVTDDAGDGEYSLNTEHIHLTDFGKDVNATIDRLIAQAQATCQGALKSSKKN